MPEIPEKSDRLVAGATLGVLGTLLVLASLMAAMDAHYVTRREYVATLEGIHAELYYLRTGTPPLPAKVKPSDP